MSPATWAGFLLACASGAVCRYLLDRWLTDRTGGNFPWGIWTVNATGSLLLGLIVGYAVDGAGNPALITIAGTGFCGSYTTFSTFAFQTLGLAKHSRPHRAIANLAGSVAAGVAAAATGWWIGSSLF